MLLGIIGITGKMGKSLLNFIKKDTSIKFSGGLSSSNFKENIFQNSDVLIDFSSPDITSKTLQLCIKYKKPLVIGTTGLSNEQKNEIFLASKKIPILYSSNFSVGIAIVKMISKITLEKTKDSRINIFETHHKNKKDTPSGTALMLKENLSPDISIYSKRENDIIGHHLIEFSTEQEQIKISHKALSRDIFTKGAIMSAKYLHNKKNGLYSLEDAIF